MLKTSKTALHLNTASYFPRKWNTEKPILHIKLNWIFEQNTQRDRMDKKKKHCIEYTYNANKIEMFYKVCLNKNK